MKEKRILYAIGYVNDQYIEEMYAVEKERVKNRSPKRIWLVAAIVAFILCLVGCAVAYVLSLEDMVLGIEYKEGLIGEKEPFTRLSLQGYVGSPSYMGAKEWYEFEQSYDPDRTIMQSLSNEEMIMPEEYWSYSCYTPEMTAKLDEICQKYGLEKQGKAFFPLRKDDFYAALQITSLVKADAQAESDLSPEYFYKTGTFSLSCETRLTGNDSPWAYSIEYQYYCVMKTDLDDVYLNIGDVENYDQWEYTTRDGTNVLLALSNDKALLIADLEKAFVTMNILNPRVGDVLLGEQKMTREAMEAFAEVFDFSFVPQPPSEEVVSRINAEYDAYRVELQAKQEAEREEFQEYLGRASYEARVIFHLTSDAEPARLGYTFYDLDGNGTKELVISRDGYIENIYSEEGDQTTAILGWPTFSNYTYLAEDGTLVADDGNVTRFFHVENGQRVHDYWVEYRATWIPKGKSPWLLCYSVDDERHITEEEYHRYRTEKKRVVLEMLPLTDYPLSEPVEYHADGKIATLYRDDTYEALIQNRVLNPVEWEPGEFLESHYVLMDLDGDGQQELILDDSYCRVVYTMLGEKMVTVFTGSSIGGSELNICKGNIIELVYSYSGQNKVYCYYRMSGTTGKMVEYLRYDADRNPSNPWFRSTDITGQDMSLVPITKVEFDNIRQTYAHIELDWKPVEEYPFS